MTLPILLFLKAAIKTQIQVPGFYKKDGTYVQPHTRTVLVDPDKDKASVLSGAGSHYQKVAHKLVQQHVQGWDDLNDDDKHAILLAHATDLQQAASASAAISMWKKAALAGQNPKKAQWAAFHNLPPEKQAKLMALVKDKVGSIGHLAGALHAAQPQAQEPAAVDGPLAGMSIGKKLEGYPKDKIQKIAEGHQLPKVKEHAKAVLAAQASAPKPGASEPSVAPGGKAAAPEWDKHLLPDSNSNAKTHNGVVSKIKALYEAGDLDGLQALADKKAGAKQTYVKKQHALALAAIAALKGDAPSDQPKPAAQPAEPEAPKPADQTVPVFESYDDGLDWAKKRAKDLGLGWQQYTATDEYKQHVYPMLSKLYASYKADHTEQQTNAGKALQAEMAKLGLKPGDKVTWSQPGPFLSTVTMSGVLKLDGNGVPHVHLDHEIAVAKPGGKIGYTKKLRWQPFMKPAAAPTVADGQPTAAKPHKVKTETEAKQLEANIKDGDGNVTAAPAPAPATGSDDPFAGMKLPGDLKEYLLKPSVTLKDGKTISAKEYIDGLLADGYGNPEYFAAAKGSQAGFLTKPGSPKVTLNDKQMFYADAAFMAKKKAGKAPDAGPKEGDTKSGAGTYEHNGTKKPIPNKDDGTGTLSPASTGWLHAYQWGIDGTGDGEVKNPIPSDAVLAELAQFVGKSPVKLYRAVYEGADDSGKLVESWTRFEKHASDLVAANAELGKKMKVVSQVFQPEQIIVDTTKLPKKFNDAHDAGTQAEVVVALGSFAEHLKAVRSGAVDTGPKEGDTKPAADGGTLVLKDGHWVKQDQPVAPPVTADDLAAVAKMKAEKVAKTKAALEAKGYGFQEHPIKGLLFAPHKGGMAWSTTSEEAAQQKAQELEQQGLDVSIIGDSPYLIKVHNVLASGASSAPAAAAPAVLKVSDEDKVQVDAANYTNTQDGHSKFWSVSVYGNVLMTQYGKIGSKGQKTVKEFFNSAAAQQAAGKLIAQKKAKGYVHQGTVKHEYDAPGGSVEHGPKEGDTKTVDGVTYVLKDGRWHKAAPDAAPAPAPAAAKTEKDFFYKKLTKQKIADVISKISPGKTGFILNEPGKKAQEAALNGNGALMYSYWKEAINIGLPKTASHIKAVAEAMGVDTSSWGARQDAQPSSAATDPNVASKPSAPVLSAGTSKKINGAAPVRSMNGWTQVGGQKGSNEGALYQDKNGQKWYCKFPADQDVVLNEFLANRFYVMLGLKAPELRLVENDGKLGIASKWIDGLTKGSAEDLAKAPGAKEGFVVDAWLANWDVVGLGNDNLMLDASGRAVRVDAGGSLLYRAQGGPKGDAFGSEVAELETLLDASKNPKSAAVFGGITDQELREGARRLAKLKPSQIEELVGKAGPTDPAVRSQLASTLIARRAYILDKLGVDDPWSSKPVDTKRLDVSGVDFPSPLNFSNWKGTGKGLSSKEHLNELNSKDSAAMVAFAKLGNLDALKDYHYDAVDKETGKVIGKKPITEHPSTHIQEQWAGLIELLQSIAFPLKDTLSMPDLGEFGGSLGEIAESAKPFDPKQTVESVPAEHRMGFFMAIGQASEEAAKEALNSIPWFWAKKSALGAKLKKGYSKLSTLVKKYVSAVQSSGWVNHVWSKGDKEVLGHNVTQLAAEIYKHAYEVEEGLQMWRWMDDTTAGKSMSKALLNAKPGLILQNTNSMCTSYAEHWGDEPHFGSDVLMRIRCAKGVKVTPSAGSGNFSKEYELTTLPGQRFLVVGVKKGVPSNPNGVLLDVIALPPDQGYVAQLNDPAYYKSVLMFFGGSSEWLTPALSKRSSAKGTSSIRLTRATWAIPTSSIA